ncbi:CbtA family protein [Agrobacterium rosae]|uniref:CbtA family protein n=1 Tax=Agrobacterium rosae TaxID=1972867 RepID=A0AAW9FMW1_9HYPH|nr:CbtA family protein [Agrobacterium rosae]MDX8304466.1 CbtA family protein [Agrobacterium rosae]
MSYFRSIVFCSVLIGLTVGLVITTIQYFGTTRLIAQAEVYESAGTAHEIEAKADHHEGDHAWEPEDGWERNAYTFAANSLTAIGYSLALLGLMSMQGKISDWKEGLFWGIAAFVCVMLAPMLGLPPELPGTPAGPLADRQLWWAGTALATAGGLWLLAFKRTPWIAVVAVALIVSPHLIGAPLAPEGEHALAPESLERQFVVAAVITSFVFWALLGSLSGVAAKRIAV